MYSTSSRDNNLGVIPVAAIGGAISAGASVIKSLFGGKQQSPAEVEALRMRRNEEAYARALQGDSIGLNFLKARSGRYAPVPGNYAPWTTETSPKPWGSESARADAYQKVQSLASARPGASAGAALGQASLGPMIAIALAGAAAIALTSGKRR